MVVANGLLKRTPSNNNRNDESFVVICIYLEILYVTMIGSVPFNFKSIMFLGYTSEAIGLIVARYFYYLLSLAVLSVPCVVLLP